MTLNYTEQEDGVYTATSEIENMEREGKLEKEEKNLTMSKQDFLQDQVFACDCNAILNYCQKLVLDF